ncbi:hypothetical protein RSSM_03009 [Rhodopirellula sallentina SM41]|uniref:Uncharacterized protein n=1 Tax=Rhodopirellula sallentina SM41 TaxID=1263870 RepID=M5U2N7_9BACT|nr:hypothetical protein RSSM_03009 [Rhodopirellula sallentina SM41]
MKVTEMGVMVSDALRLGGSVGQDDTTRFFGISSRSYSNQLPGKIRSPANPIRSTRP